ncbi:MAG: hypothetical protein KF886_08770 [Candidatus Hydrogenedentes bacterium]|nr:hypothetical protein [Candidatus Hydrogenedentota bacterium]
MRYLLALLLLQFHLARNTMTRGKLVAVFLIGAVVAGAALFSGVLGAFFYLAGAAWLPRQPHAMQLLLLHLLALLYVLVWFWSFAFEMQRSDVIDIRKMLHFPVPLAAINLLNFVVSLFTFPSLFYVAAAAGLVTGIGSARGGGYLAGYLAATVFFLAVSAWGYCLRGQMAVWMADKRRRRVLLSVLPVLFMVTGFMPLLLSQSMIGGRSAEALLQWLGAPEQQARVARASQLLPTGWIAIALAGMGHSQTASAAPIAGLAALALLGYHRAYRTTLRYCFGAGQHQGAPSTAGRKLPMTARRIPGLAEDTAALAIAAFLNFVRHPHMRAMMLAPFGIIILLAALKSQSAMSGRDLGMPILVVMWPFFLFSSFFFNLFGADTRGFRTIMLLPIPRHRVLLAYHIALLPLAGGLGLIFALGGSWYFGLPPATAATALLQIVLLFTLFALAGSFLSIYAPFAMGRNMMQGQKSRSLLMTIVMPLVIGLLLLPSGLCFAADAIAARWGLENAPAGVLLSALFVAMALAAYPAALRHAGDLLVTREQRILEILQRTAA